MVLGPAWTVVRKNHPDSNIAYDAKVRRYFDAQTVHFQENASRDDD